MKKSEKNIKIFKDVNPDKWTNKDTLKFLLPYFLFICLWLWLPFGTWIKKLLTNVLS